MVRIHKILLSLLCCSLLFCSCARNTAQMTDAEKSTSEEAAATVPVPEVTPEVFRFVDAHGEEHETELNPDVARHPYDADRFEHRGDILSYEDDSYTSRIGIDVSRHQGKINWKKVKKAGISFAFLRIGFRGYGEEGRLVSDEQFARNLRKAQAQGIDVGVYFFAQAVDEEEAEEEAEFVLHDLAGAKLQLPVVYDPESILNDDARTDGVSGEQFTKNTKVFCERIKAAGYEPAIYCNMMWEAYMLDLEELSDLPVWYADYEAVPQTPYAFEYWQYTDCAKIDGIQGGVDMNIQILEK